ncbi:uncharacterized protein RCO7_09528 [Rhynchosporium graminicola]|uniref:Uncharacterized protein n=1 Tax=Rhynchosporium graminicola TaxID=2792576 RepID=A0A1E1KA83_9HELO|nr:uncharacterized protein RCO7_09528 [Rhynchosporium commune]
MSSMANGDIKTMNPADKFLTPRMPPSPPTLQRLNTSSSVLTKKRSARSLSPNSKRSGWPPRMFLGFRLPYQPSSQSVDTRGRSSSLSKVQHSRVHASTPNLREEARKARSVPPTREASPQSFKRLHSRDPSPHLVQDSTAYNTTVLDIPHEIEEEVEEGEDDDNFACQLSRMSFTEKCITPLAPPPSATRPPPPPRTCSASMTRDVQKPLPQLPEEDLRPQPLRLRPAFSMANLPRSHFSTSTVGSSPIASPTDSHFSFISEHSISSDTNDDEEDLAADVGSGDDFTYSPISIDIPSGGFSGYSLPEADYASEQTLRKATPLSQLSPTTSRATFGAPHPAFEPQVEQMSALQQLLNEMGYLGEVIAK